MRTLIVNADDFGHSAAVNAGVIEAHRRGIVTAASLMVRRPGAEEAAALARPLADLDLGLHVDLGEWAYRDAVGWVALYEVDPAQMQEEVGIQLQAFRMLLGRDPTHVDSHQHVHLREPAQSVLLGVAAELGVPLRHFSERVRYCGAFYGQTETGEPLPDAVGVPALLDVIRTLPAGTTELCCHPARGKVSESSYAAERNRELETLCDGRVRAVLDEEGIALSTFVEPA